jgi:hypothetical protein
VEDDAIRFDDFVQKGFLTWNIAKSNKTLLKERLAYKSP